MSRTTKIGLFGFGCVGRGFYQIATAATNSKIEIAAICVKHPDKARSLPRDVFTFDADAIINNPDIDIVVELIDNAEDAFKIASAALRKGKPVVSANKRMIAERFAELQQLQRDGGSRLLYEAAVGGSIPIIRALEAYFDGSAVRSLGGIVNGSSNYVLTRMQDDGLSYDEALAEAREAGFAESDPTLDLGGFDARNKLSILTRHALSCRLAPEKIPTFGLRSVNSLDVLWAREHSLRIVPAVSARRLTGGVCAWSAPQLVTQSERIGSAVGENNIVLVEDANGVTTEFTGKGAGGIPTAAAVLADVNALNRNFAYRPVNDRHCGVASLDDLVDVLIRGAGDDNRIPVEFQDVYLEEDYRNSRIVVGRAALNKLASGHLPRRRGSFVALLSGPTVAQLTGRGVGAAACVC